MSMERDSPGIGFQTESIVKKKACKVIAPWERYARTSWGLMWMLIVAQTHRGDTSLFLIWNCKGDDPRQDYNLETFAAVKNLQAFNTCILREKIK